MQLSATGTICISFGEMSSDVQAVVYADVPTFQLVSIKHLPMLGFLRLFAECLKPIHGTLY